MSSVVIRICDRCKREVDRLWEIGITCEPIGDFAYRMGYHTIQKQQRAEWCVDCIDEMGVKRPLVRADKEPEPVTIEDIIRGIIRSEKGDE